LKFSFFSLGKWLGSPIASVAFLVILFLGVMLHKIPSAEPRIYWNFFLLIIGISCTVHFFIHVHRQPKNLRYSLANFAVFFLSIAFFTWSWNAISGDYFQVEISESGSKISNQPKALTLTIQRGEDEKLIERTLFSKLRKGQILRNPGWNFSAEVMWLSESTIAADRSSRIKKRKNGRPIVGIQSTMGLGITERLALFQVPEDFIGASRGALMMIRDLAGSEIGTIILVGSEDFIGVPQEFVVNEIRYRAGIYENKVAGLRSVRLLSNASNYPQLVTDSTNNPDSIEIHPFRTFEISGDQFRPIPFDEQKGSSLVLDSLIIEPTKSWLKWLISGVIVVSLILLLIENILRIRKS